MKFIAMFLNAVLAVFSSFPLYIALTNEYQRSGEEMMIAAVVLAASIMNMIVFVRFQLGGPDGDLLSLWISRKKAEERERIAACNRRATADQ
jgi:hypothetical protein